MFLYCGNGEQPAGTLELINIHHAKRQIPVVFHSLWLISKWCDDSSKMCSAFLPLASFWLNKNLWECVKACFRTKLLVCCQRKRHAIFLFSAVVRICWNVCGEMLSQYIFSHRVDFFYMCMALWKDVPQTHLALWSEGSKKLLQRRVLFLISWIRVFLTETQTWWFRIWTVAGDKWCERVVKCSLAAVSEHWKHKRTR